MIVEFKGKKTSLIPEWCRENPEGYCLELNTARRARLHSASFEKDGEHFKIEHYSGCSTNPDELIKWGKSKRKHVLAHIDACSICFPNGFKVSKYNLFADNVVHSWPFPTPDSEGTSWPFSTGGILGTETSTVASITESAQSKPYDNAPTDGTPLVDGVQGGSDNWRNEKSIITLSEHNENAAPQLAVSAVEGILRETMVITKSRNGTLRRAALEKAHGGCAACGVDYSLILDGLGQRVLQVHHRQQLALADAPQVNGIEDLAVVCANCHQMIHADMANAMPVEELRERLRDCMNVVR